MSCMLKVLCDIYFKISLFVVPREFRDATRAFARFKNHSDWEEFLNGHLRKYKM